MSEIFYSQIGQDEYYLKNISNFKKNGVFIDIGAHDGITFSNTYYFEKELGWTGICIEPNPSTYIKCCENRKNIIINKAIYKTSNEKIDFIVPCGNQNVGGGVEQLCGIKGYIREQNINHIFADAFSQYNTIQVETININDLLNQYNIHNIDYMSIDTEGYELEILKSIDYEKNKIQYITVEHGCDLHFQDEIRTFMETKNYQRHRINEWDDEYILL